MGSLSSWANTPHAKATHRRILVRSCAALPAPYRPSVGRYGEAMPLESFRLWLGRRAKPASPRTNVGSTAPTRRPPALVKRLEPMSTGQRRMFLDRAVSAVATRSRGEDPSESVRRLEVHGDGQCLALSDLEFLGWLTTPESYEVNRALRKEGGHSWATRARTLFNELGEDYGLPGTFRLYRGLRWFPSLPYLVPGEVVDGGFVHASPDRDAAMVHAGGGSDALFVATFQMSNNFLDHADAQLIVPPPSRWRVEPAVLDPLVPGLIHVHAVQLPTDRPDGPGELPDDPR